MEAIPDLSSRLRAVRATSVADSGGAGQGYGGADRARRLAEELALDTRQTSLPGGRIERGQPTAARKIRT